MKLTATVPAAAAPLDPAPSDPATAMIWGVGFSASPSPWAAFTETPAALTVLARTLARTELSTKLYATDAPKPNFPPKLSAPATTLSDNASTALRLTLSPAVILALSSKADVSCDCRFTAADPVTATPL